MSRLSRLVRYLAFRHCRKIDKRITGNKDCVQTCGFAAEFGGDCVQGLVGTILVIEGEIGRQDSHVHREFQRFFADIDGDDLMALPTN